MRYIYLTLILILAGFSSSAQTFFKGVDLSYVNEMEDCGASYYENGTLKDPFLTLRDHGANLVRVRLWHTPTAWSGFPTSYSSFEDAKASISRAKALGMQVLLDFHYSDTWADPGKQIIPAAWEHLVDNTSVLADSVYQYTYQTLVKLDDLGLMPDLVQVGNETNGDILRLEGDDLYPVDWNRNSILFNAGIQAVRDAGGQSNTQPLVVLHVADPNNGDWWLGEATSHGITDFDIFGLSFYPEWHSGSVSQTGDIIENLKSTYQKEVMLVETGVPWTSDWNDDATNMLSTCPKGYGKVSVDCQRNWLIAMATEVSLRGGLGMIYWEPAWVSTGCNTEWGDGSHWENAAFWDFENELIANGGVQFLEQNYGSSNTAPSATFTFAVNNLSVDFNGSASTDPDGTISSWSWDFGDGSTGSGTLVSHTYSASGNYTVTLSVTDNDGATDTDTQMVSVSDGSSGEPTSMHVQSILTGTENAGQGNKRGSATVTVHNDLEDPVSGVTVTGTFSGTFSETVSGQTGQDGMVTLVTSNVAKGGVTVNFCVDDLAHPDLSYADAQNDITCTGGGSRMADSPANGNANSDLLIYPNPANISATVNMADAFSRIHVVDPSGRIIEDVKLSGENVLTVDTRMLEPGLYFIKAIKNDGTNMLRRLIITR